MATQQRMNRQADVLLDDCFTVVTVGMLMQVPELPVYGVAIPTVSGLQRVLHILGAEHGERAEEHHWCTQKRHLSLDADE